MMQMKIVATAEGEGTISKEANTTMQFIEDLQAGPEWAKGIVKDYLNFIQEDLLGALKGVVDVLKTLPEELEK